MTVGIHPSRSRRASVDAVAMWSIALIGLVALGCGAASPAPTAGRIDREEAPPADEPSAPAAPDPSDPAGTYADRAALEVLTGRASYYSDRLAGRSTANGDRYDPTAFTAASRDLAFGTIVRVIREDTGASVFVRVNDRGPHRDHSRILDLSRAAAERLDMVRAGVIDIRAEIVEVPAPRER